MRKTPIAVLVGGSLLSAALAHAQAGAPAAAPPPLAAPGDSAYPQLQDPEGGADVAGAQPEPPPAQPGPANTPTETPPPGLGEVTPVVPTKVDAQFVSLDRVDGVSRAGIDLSYAHYDAENVDSNIRPLRANLWGQYVTPSGAGGFGSLNFAYVSSDDDSVSAIGNLEVGGLYAVDLGSFQGIGRASVLLPTASDGDDAFAGVIAAYSRVTDLAQAAPDSTWLRLSVSPVVRRGELLLRADVGVDIPVITDDDDSEVFLRGNLALGYLVGQHQLSAELVSLVILDDREGSDDLRIHSLGASYRGTFGNLQPYGGIYTILTNGDGKNPIDLTLTGGVSTMF